MLFYLLAWSGGGVFLAAAVGGFFFPLAGVPLSPSGQSHFQAVFKTSDTEVNLLHVLSRREDWAKGNQVT